MTHVAIPTDLTKIVCPFTEREILGDFLRPCDADAYYMGHGVGEWYYYLGFTYRPKTILELGTRWGYSLKALYEGSRAGEGASNSPSDYRLYSFDSEVDCPGSCQYVRDKFAQMNLAISVQCFKINLRDIPDDLGIGELVDLAHVDADHSIEGTYQDCHLAYRYVRSGGVMVIDDMKESATGGPTTRTGADRFLAEIGCRGCAYFDTYRGHYVLIKD
jgi:predicted O-methyltransferase YrrM